MRLHAFLLSLNLALVYREPSVPAQPTRNRHPTTPIGQKCDSLPVYPHTRYPPLQQPLKTGILN
jgi:hypothetical protein